MGMVKSCGVLQPQFIVVNGEDVNQDVRQLVDDVEEEGDVEGDVGDDAGDELPCVTTKNIPCVFPFTYQGKKYYKCTNKNYGKKLWCSTTAVYRGKWGRCKPGCKATGRRRRRRRS